MKTCSELRRTDFTRFGIYLLMPLFALFIGCGGEEEKLVEKKEVVDTLPAKVKPDISANSFSFRNGNHVKRQRPGV